MEQPFSEISFRNFGCTSRGWPKIPENRSYRKIPFWLVVFLVGYFFGWLVVGWLVGWLVDWLVD